VSNVFDEKVNELLKLDPRELANRLATVELQLEAIDPMTKFIIQNLYKPWRFVLRNNQPMVGILLNASFEPAEFIIWREEDIRDYSKKKIKHEKKYTKVKPGYLTYMDVIEYEEEKEWIEKY